MQTRHKDSSKTQGDDTIRTRIDPVVKEQWDTWCTNTALSQSQGLRWLIAMHLDQPDKLWTWLAEQNKKATNDSSTDNGSRNGS
jgi:hypothetical protein